MIRPERNKWIDFESLLKALALPLSLVVMLVAVSTGHPQLVVPMVGVVMSLLSKL